MWSNNDGMDSNWRPDFPARSDKDAEIQKLKAELVNREGEKQEMREVIDRLKAEVSDLKEVLKSKQENTRKLDIALNGEAGAAKQASLCDLIEPARQLRIDLERERAANEILRAIVRQEEIDANTIEDRSQEAAHYNWLDDQNEKLLADNAKLREALKGAREVLGPSPWGSLRHEIDALIAAKQDEGNG